MEVRFENGWAGRGWLFDPRTVGLFRQSDTTARHMVPPVDVIEDKDAYHFYFEMAGIASDSVNVRVEDGNLVVEAERKRPEWTKDAEIHLAERTYGAMHRAFTMPDDAIHDGIKAAYKDGVLEVTVPKKPESKPFKIKVEVEN